MRYTLDDWKTTRDRECVYLSTFSELDIDTFEFAFDADNEDRGDNNNNNNNNNSKNKNITGNSNSNSNNNNNSNSDNNNDGNGNKKGLDDKPTQKTQKRKRPPRQRKVEFVIKFAVNGQEYCDNNEGSNYIMNVLATPQGLIKARSI